MPNYIQFTTEDGSTILVEVAEEDGHQSGVLKAGLGDKVGEAVTEAKSAFEDGLDIVRSNAEAFIKKLRGLSEPPQEVEVSFGLKATGEVGNFAIAKASAEASYSIKLKWEPTKKRKPGQQGT